MAQKTAQSVMALPGIVHSFVAKTVAVADQHTALRGIEGNRTTLRGIEGNRASLLGAEGNRSSLLGVEGNRTSLKGDM